MERVQQVAQSGEAEFVPPERSVFLEIRTDDRTDYEEVEASLILKVGGLFLVLPRDEEDDWLMGQADGAGTIICWAYYGPLEEALQAL